MRKVPLARFIDNYISQGKHSSKHAEPLPFIKGNNNGYRITVLERRLKVNG
jgi:hypothetical protein